MMVTFVSQCEKKSLKSTRRVLDAFANRIGSRTWQTVITNEGLKAVKKLLRKTATKNSAVTCHWQRSRIRSELVWIVGNRRKFNKEGFVPVNTTAKDIMHNHWENDWHYLPLIKCLAAMAALFHDWGKASDFFQTKLKNNAAISDPLRHEWLSVLFLNCIVNNEEDEQWLTRLATEGINSSSLLEQFSELQKDTKKKSIPLANLPQGASTIAWLILSHHRMPVDREKCKIYRADPLNDVALLFKNINDGWGYKNLSDSYEEDLGRCLTFSKGLPCDSAKWVGQVQKTARKMLGCLELLDKSVEDGSWRLVLHHTRLSLMLADHYQSSLDKETRWQDEINLYANTDRKTGDFKQKLTEHLIRVARQAQRNAHLLPAFEGKQIDLPMAHDVKVLQKKSPAPFRWQDKSVAKIHQWRNERAKQFDDSCFGFFAVNMASTGKGKTFANAKIMRALSADQKSLRYILALGLRTLTLQTGDEYRGRICLDEDEVGILIGSRAVLDLHEKNIEVHIDKESTTTGSESEESLLANEIIYDTALPDDHLATILPDSKSCKLLYAPVLSCTIDHLMSATETTRGGRYILPALRLMSSDLVIDEIDDFDGNDLIAIGRLIHLAGMLGRKIMISSATIPPDLAEGYFNAYQAGWSIFAKFRNQNKEIGCCWIDEFGSRVETVQSSGAPLVTEEYIKYHQKFISRRVSELQKQVVKRKGEIWPCSLQDNEDEEQIKPYLYSTILAAVLAKHGQHHGVDKISGKKISFGLVRVANIPPCIELTKFLLNAELPGDTAIRTMAYHSQQLLIMRSAQEKHLDAVLKRGEGPQTSFDQVEIRRQLDGIEEKNVIFILVATPVEEVGRDHDFDWAVVEPSSYRSFIQLAGRILRHRNISADIEKANIALLQHNLKGLQEKKPAYCRPGYESQKLQLKCHDLQELLKGESFAERLDAEPRICPKTIPAPKTNLADLEHESIHRLLTNYQQVGPAFMQGWLSGYWWLTAFPQWLVKFRESFPQLLVYLFPENGEWKFVEKDWTGQPIPVETQYGITRDDELSPVEKSRLWLYRDYEELLETSGKSSLQKAALTYGEIGLPTYGDESHTFDFIYSNQLGLFRKIK